MAYYSFRNTKTNEEYDLQLSFAEREQYLANNPHIEQIITKAPAIGDPARMGLTKPSRDFQDRIRQIKRSHRHSTINDGNITEV